MNNLISSFLSIISYFLLNNYLSNKIVSFDYRIRVISILHCFIIIFFSILYLGNFLSCYFYINSVYFISPGYFILDFKYLISKSKNNNLLQYAYYLHHLGALIGIYFGNIYPYFLARAFLTEISTPLLNISWFLKKIMSEKYKIDSHTNLYLSIIYKINLISYFILFLIFRIYNLTDIVLNLHNIVIYHKIIIYFFTILNYCWLYSILKVIFKDFL